jgi:predicted nucleic acid-binding protein
VKKLRVYIDNSVVSGCFDEQFAEESNALFEAAREGQLTLIVSDILGLEAAKGPEWVSAKLHELSETAVERVEATEEARALQVAYLEAGVLARSSDVDALHVAIATVTHADVVVSWNMRHIVRLERIRGFNAVNLREGYGQIEIRTPREVL